jgi:mRNA interferase MazF
MRRGEVWTCAGGADYVGKPRPAVIVQSDGVPPGGSITLCPLTTSEGVSAQRILIVPGEKNGLRQACSVMVDKITTLPRTKMGRRVGALTSDEMLEIEHALRIFLAIETPVSP